ncbi:hypothetical protein ACA910_018786 [Epithemia clementina (nom. ined.)]
MVRRMAFDVEALEAFTTAAIPPERLLRPSKTGSKPSYIFADASGAGFGSSDWTPLEKDLAVVYGSWPTSYKSCTSSNFRALKNIVDKIERLDEEGWLLENTEVFVFTDNQHAESAFYRGTAKSPEVLRLMFCLHRILIRGYSFIHIILWIAGKRMIDQGTDGLSRSDLTSGVMRGQDMLSFVP